MNMRLAIDETLSHHQAGLLAREKREVRADERRKSKHASFEQESSFEC